MRQDIIEAIDLAVLNGARILKACDAISLCPRRLRRWRHLETDRRVGGYRAKTQKLSIDEQNRIIENFTNPEYKDLPYRVAHAKLMDNNIYVASPASCIRVMNKAFPKHSRINPNAGRKRPELSATAPGQVWCWDITWLPSKVRGKYFYLYMIIDMYSRFIVDWEIHTSEDGQLARSLFMRAVSDNGLEDTGLIVHADNGSAMRSETLNAFFNRMSVEATHSRPHTSNDNAFAESIFATLKGRVLYPEYFSTIEGSELFVEQFVEWYNYDHQHSSLDYLKPYEVHHDVHRDILNNRNEIMTSNRLCHPSRHGGRKKHYQIPEIIQLKHRVTCKIAS